MTKKNNKIDKITTKICKDCGIEKDLIYFKVNKKTKDGHVSVCKDCMNKKIIITRNNNNHTYYYVYRFLDKDDNIIYVGKTTNIYQRIFVHISKSISFYHNENQSLMYPNVYKIEYCQVPSDYHMNIYEMHYICKYNPPFNTNYKTNNKQLFNLPELSWKLYIFNSFVKDYIEFFYKINDKKDINVKDELNNNINFYNEWVDVYFKTHYTHRQFNPESYFYDDFYDDNDEIIIDDDLDYCKYNCDDCDEDISENCCKKVTWRDVYNQKVTESKLMLIKEDIFIDKTTTSEVCI